jgi:hypothetical protein
MGDNLPEEFSGVRISRPRPILQKGLKLLVCSPIKIPLKKMACHLIFRWSPTFQSLEDFSESGLRIVSQPEKRHVGVETLEPVERRSLAKQVEVRRLSSQVY